MKKIINLSTAATEAIERLQHNCGTFEFYASTLSRLFNYIFDQSEEIGMDDTEAMHTLRALRYLKDDITQIAGKGGSPVEIRIEADMEAVEQSVESAFNESAEKVEETFSGVIVPGDQLDEPREMLHDIGVAYQRANHLQCVISEAITHATNAGEKYKCVISDLADINGDLETVTAQLDALMAIDPDTFEPKELTNHDHANRNVLKAIDAIAAAKEYLDDALDYAKRSENLDKAILRRIETTREQVIRAAAEALNYR